MKALVILTLALGGCATFSRPCNVTRVCYRPAPCEDEWLGLSKGGCALIVVNQTCPDGSTEVGGDDDAE